MWQGRRVTVTVAPDPVPITNTVRAAALALEGAPWFRKQYGT